MKAKLLPAVAGILLLLTGCTTSSPDTKTEDPNAIKFVASEEDPKFESTEPTWAKTGDNSVEVHLYGSSSCPPEIQEVTQDEEGSMNVKLKANDQKACTLDFGGPHAWEISNLPQKTEQAFLCGYTNSENCIIIPEYILTK
jgi:hypothetical protein